MHIAAKTFDVNCDPLSVRTSVSLPMLLTQCSEKIVPTVFAVVFVVGTTLGNFENRFVITKRCWLPLFVSGRGIKISMAVSSSGSDAEKAVVFVVILSFGVYARMTFCS